MKLSEELQWRGFINQTTFADLSQLDDRQWTFYHGFDASADSQTIGNLASMMLDKVFLRHGHKAVLLAGGATSLIGDPGGKDKERQLQSEEIIAANVSNAQQELKKVFAGYDFKLVNNLDWYRDMNVMYFLREVGKHFSMTPLVQRDYIAKRMGEGGSGISYTEFSYTLLQGYDFLRLNEDYGVNLQLAGSDQWGNCLSGIDLVRRVNGKEVHAITCPLIINQSTGVKFGKSESGAIWLNPKKTSPYKFYQFWLNLADEGIEGYLKIFTELDKPTIDSAMQEFKQDRSSRGAQKLLAYEVTRMLHGEVVADSVVRVSEVLFGGQPYSKLQSDDIDQLKNELPVVATSSGADIEPIIVSAGLAGSNSEARRFLSQGAIYLNGQQATGDNLLSRSNTIDGHHIILRRGKNSNAIVHLDA